MFLAAAAAAIVTYAVATFRGQMNVRDYSDPRKFAGLKFASLKDMEMVSRAISHYRASLVVKTVLL